MANKKYDFSGYATKNDIRCEDGRVIKKDAFKDCDGQKVPICWMHKHDSPESVIGHAFLENRNDGVYCYGFLNEDTDGGKQCKSILKHGDICSLSIYANNLVQNGHDVIRGVIREVSLVLAGANRGALVDNVVLAHGCEPDEGDGLVVFGGDLSNVSFNWGESLYHSSMSSDEDEDDDEDETEESDVDAIERMDKNQKKAMYKMMDIAKADALGLLDSDEDNDDEDETLDDDIFVDELDDEDDDEEENDNEDNNEEENDMSHYIFENDNADNSMQHCAMMAHSADFVQDVLADAQKYGSLKDSVLAHSQEYGIENIDYLFPDAKNLNDKPEYIKRRTEWVNEVLQSCGTSPFARIKTIFADITEDTARAKGYIKGNRKVEEVFRLLKRNVNPTTIYKKQAFDRDDIVDATDLDVIAFVKEEMRIMFDEECARGILFGDGRSYTDPDKIKEDCIIPVWKDDDLFTVKCTVPVSSTATAENRAKSIIKSLIKERKKYKGSGNPSLYISEDLLADMLLIEDGIGHYLYTVDSLKNILRVSKIVSVPIMEDMYRVDEESGDTKYLAAILVNLSDYKIGRDKLGKLNFWDDFDMDFNKMKYLMESRFSGALTIPYSALAFEIVYNLLLIVEAELGSTTVLGKSVSDCQENVYVSDSSISGTLKYINNWTAYSEIAAENTGYFVVLKFTDSENAVTKVRTIGGINDSREVTLDSDKQAVIRVMSPRQKIVVTSTLNGETIEKTLSCSGLKMPRA